MQNTADDKCQVNSDFVQEATRVIVPHSAVLEATKVAAGFGDTVVNLFCHRGVIGYYTP